jgi:hypothetical protein
MHRRSERENTLGELKNEIKHRMTDADMCFILDEEDELEDELDDMLLDEHSKLSSQQFFERGEHRNEPTKWEKELHDKNFMKDNEFLVEYRVSCPYFHIILEIIKDHAVFISKKILKPFKGGPELHLMALLRYIGGCGNQISVLKISRDLVLGKGSVPNYVRRAITAILKLRSGYVGWPTPEERINIAERISKKFDIPKCVGIIDGTLFPLETRPLINGEDYFTRKGFMGSMAL